MAVFHSISFRRHEWKTIQWGTPDTHHIHQQRDNSRGSTITPWVERHKDVPDTEANDGHTKAAAYITPDSPPRPNNHPLLKESTWCEIFFLGELTVKKHQTG